MLTKISLKLLPFTFIIFDKNYRKLENCLHITVKYSIEFPI